jgi:hypothetical protein
MSRFRAHPAHDNRGGEGSFQRREQAGAAISVGLSTAKGNDMTAVIQAAKFHESLIFGLVERLLDYGAAAEGKQFPLDPVVIDLLRRAAETTEGFPSQTVQEAYKEIFMQDVWEKLPPN